MSRIPAPGETLYIRATVVSPGSDCVQVLIDDGVLLSITTWVPSAECAALDDIARLKPIRRIGGFLDR
jgi:hypothetical protein